MIEKKNILNSGRLKVGKVIAIQKITISSWQLRGDGKERKASHIYIINTILSKFQLDS